MFLNFRFSLRIFALLTLSLPQLLWAQDWSWAFGVYSANSELAKDVAVNDSLGEVWILGEFDGPVASLPGIPTPAAANRVNGLLIKLDTNGVLQDYIVIPSVGNLQMNALALDDSGNVYVVGAFSEDVVFTGNGTDSIGLSPSVILIDGFVAKFNSNLEGVWATRIQGIFNQIVKDVAVNGSDVVVVGDFQSFVRSDTLGPLSSSGSYDVFVMSFAKGSGKPRWSNKLGGSGVDQVEGVVCRSGDIYVCGHFAGDSLYFPGARASALVNTNFGNTDFFVSRIDTNSRTGAWLVNGGGMGDDRSHGIAVSSGGVFIGGEINTNASFGAAGSVTPAGGKDGFVTGLDAATGQFQWVRPEGGAGNEVVWDVVQGRDGNIIAAGEFSNTVVFSGGVPATPLSGTDGFLVGYEVGGTPLSWMRRIGNLDVAVPKDLDAVGSGIYASGEYLFSATTFFAPASITLPGNGMENLFVGRLGCEQIPNPNLSATVNVDSVCLGDSVEISIPLSLNTLFYQLIELGGDTLGPVTQGVNGLLTLTSDALVSTLSIGVLVLGNGVSCEVLAQDTLDIFVQGQFVPDLGPDDSSCGIPLTLLPIGSWSSYAWSTGATTDSIVVGVSGDYNVEVTDSLGCTGRDTVVIVVSPLPTVDLGLDTTICQGDSLNLDAGPGAMSYIWSTGAMLNPIWVSSGGEYAVTITDSVGCMGSDTIELSLDSLNLNLPSDTSFCLGDSVVLEAGSGSSGYGWSTGATTQSIFVSSGGSYAVTVSNGTCTDSAATNVVGLALPQPDLGADTVLCNAAMYPLDASLGGITNYLWNTGATNPILSVVADGSYSIVVTDTAGCIGMDTVAITFEDIVLNLPSDTSFCLDDSVLLDAGAGGNSYGWSTGATTQSIFVSSGGSYAVTVSNGTCTDSAATNVAVLALPQPDLGADTVLCNAAMYPLDASLGGITNYLWNTGATNPVLSVVADGSYSIVVTDTAGCIGMDTVEVTFEDIVLNLPSDTSFCLGDSVLLDAGAGGNSYAWSNGASSQMIHVSTDGIYSVTVSSLSCSDSAFVNVTALALPEPTLGNDTLLCNTSPFQLDAGQPGFVSYLWNSGSTNTTLDVTGTGIYAVTVTDGSGCRGSDTISVAIETLVLGLPTDTSFCQGDSVRLDAGPGWGTYQWSSGNSSQSIVVNSGGTFGVTVSGMICRDSALVNVVVGNLPGLELGPDTVLCNASGYLLDANVPGGLNYLWSTGDSTPTLQVVAGGLYSVTASNAAGCQATDQVDVAFTELNIDLPSDTSFCLGDSVRLDAAVPGATYQWSTGTTAQSIVVNGAGTFGVTVSLGGCVDSVLVNVLAGVLPGIELGNDTSLCAGDSLLLDAGSPGLGIVWQDGSMGSTYQVTGAGFYSVEVSDNAGCTARDTIEVLYAGSLAVSVTGLAPNLCETDGAVTLNAQPPGGVWSTGGGIFNPGTVGPGNYLLSYTYTDAQGCSNQWLGTTVVDALPSPADAGADQSLPGNVPVLLAGNAPLVGNGTWTTSDVNGIFSDPTSPTTSLQLSQGGDFMVFWTIANGSCPVSVDSLRLEVQQLLVPSGFSPNGDGTNELLVIRGIEFYSTRSFEVFNRWGNTVYSSANYANQWDGGGLVDDTYFYILDLGEAGKMSGYIALKR